MLKGMPPTKTLLGTSGASCAAAGAAPGAASGAPSGCAAAAGAALAFLAFLASLVSCFFRFLFCCPAQQQWTVSAVWPEALAQALLCTWNRR